MYEFLVHPKCVTKLFVRDALPEVDAVMTNALRISTDDLVKCVHRNELSQYRDLCSVVEVSDLKVRTLYAIATELSLPHAGRESASSPLPWREMSAGILEDSVVRSDPAHH